jgi:hypothetical protein
MSDNISVTAGSGTAVSTEEVTTLNGSSVSARHVQRVGLAQITGDGVAVDVTATAPLNAVLGAGSALIGKVQVNTPMDSVQLIPTLDTAAYAAGDSLFAPVAITVARVNDERAVLLNLAAIDKDKQAAQIRLFFFKANPSSWGAANAAVALSDADAVNYLGHVDISTADWVILANNHLATKTNLAILLEAGSGVQTVYVAGQVATGTPAFTASGLVFNFGVAQS